MSIQNKKSKDFDYMSAEEKYIYASTWDSHKKQVAAVVANLVEIRFGIPAEEVDFEVDFREITSHREKDAMELLIEIHQILDIKVDDAELQPYDVYDTLFDLVLILSAELTDNELGYLSMLDEMELEFVK